MKGNTPIPGGDTYLSPLAETILLYAQDGVLLNNGSNESYMEFTIGLDDDD